MKKTFVIVGAVFLIAVAIAVSTVAAPDVLTPSEDPVAFIAQHKGGAEPNYYYEETTEWDVSKYVGPDGYEYYGEFYGGIFWVDSRVEALVAKEEYFRYTDVVFSKSFDFNQRSFCRYFGITEKEYSEAISVFSNFEMYGEGGQYMAEKYPVGIYGTYDDFIEVFVREEYRADYRTEECIPGDDCVHTFTYHTITDELIDYVGEEEYAGFREKYYGTEDFNILQFIEYFDISEEEMEKILTESEDLLPAYKTEYLYGDEEMQREYFFIRAAQ